MPENRELTVEEALEDYYAGRSGTDIVLLLVSRELDMMDPFLAMFLQEKLQDGRISHDQFVKISRIAQLEANKAKRKKV